MSDPLKVAIDVRMAQHTGIGRYIRGLVGGLADLGEAVDLSLLGPEGKIPYNAPIYSVAEQIEGARLCRDARLAGHVLHFPHYNVPWTIPGRSVVSIHDLTHFSFARHHSSLRLFLARRLLARAVRRAGAIVTVSTATADALVEEFPEARSKLTTVHHGIAPQFERLPPAPVEEFTRRHEVAQPLLLYVGNDRPHKNLEFFMQAADELRSRLPRLTVGLVGPIERDYREREWVRQPGAVTDEELVLWYNAATVLIQPSLNEGFGLTALEGMACGTPVAASRIAAHEEIIGVDGRFFDPRSGESFIETVSALLDDDAARDDLAGRARRRAATFTWEATAQRTLGVYRRVAREAGGAS